MTRPTPAPSPTPARSSTVRLVSAAALALLLAGPALLQPAQADDDRRPTEEEMAKIEESLRTAGYVSWEEVDMDDGQWDVDDARKAGSSAEYDIRIDPRTYAILTEELDD